MCNIKYCELYDGKICDNCNECNICDLDPSKVCDSCGRCIDETESDYLEVLLDGILEEDEAQDYPYSPDEAETSDSYEDELLDMEYLEDIPELKAEYDRRISAILKGEEVEEGHKHRH